MEELGDTVVIAKVGTVFFERLFAPAMLNRATDEEAVSDALENGLPPHFDYLDEQLSSSPFLVGDMMSAGDITHASYLVNLKHASYEPDPQRWPNLCAWRDRMHARESFQKSLVMDQALLATFGR